MQDARDTTDADAPADPKLVAPWPRQLLVGLVALVLFAELLLTGSAGPAVEAPRLDSAEDVRGRIAALSQADASRRWLLLGDSVLVGDTGQRELATWDEHRILDYLRREAALTEDVAFDQVALDGMLPVDMLAVVEALDARDPEGEVGLVVELSPRHFSPSYAEQRAFSRPFLAELSSGEGAGEAGEGGLLDTIGRSRDRALSALRPWIPVYRHRERFAWARAGLEPSVEAEASEAGAGEVDRLEALARLGVHYGDLAVEAEAEQAAAVRAIADRCRARGRHLVFVATPVEDVFWAAHLSEAEQGAYLAAVDALVDVDGEGVELLPFDHPMFASELFWDHVHLRPEGNRLWATNLLHQLGVGLERSPDPRSLIARDGGSTSLVARIETGYADGAAWQARFRGVRGLAVAPEGRWVVIADAENHVLRELRGDLRVVRTLAGEPEVSARARARERLSEDREGLEPEPPLGMGPLLHRPAAPAILGDAAYFGDDDGRVLRRVVDGRLETLLRLPGGVRARSMKAHDGRLFALGSRGQRQQLIAIEVEGLEALEPAADASAKVRPRPGATQVLVQTDSSAPLSAFALSPTGDLYLAGKDGRIWRLAQGASRTERLDLAAAVRAFEAEQATPLELVYANTADRVFPQIKGKHFPFSVDEVHLSQVVELIYVERYGGLLIQDRTPHRQKGKYANPITERVHLRYLDLDEGLIYPWLEPRVAATGYYHHNKGTLGYSSAFHEGFMALDPSSASLYYLESGRSRLIRMGDGLLGVAKISSVDTGKPRDLFGVSAGERTFARFSPDRFVDAGAEPVPREGPYQVLMLGSSMLAMADIDTQYSMGRRLAERLEHVLSTRDRVALDTYMRTFPGGVATKQVEFATNFYDAGGRPDVLVFETNSSIFLAEDATEAQMQAVLDDMVALAARWDSLLLILDTAPYMIRNRDGLRPVLPRIQRFHALARARGVEVVEVGDAILDRHLEVVPFSNASVLGVHPAAWALDAVGDQLAATIVPKVRAHLRDTEDGSLRTPAWRLDAPPVALEAGTRLLEAFSLPPGVEPEQWGPRLPSLPEGTVQTELSAGRLRAFVDLGQLERAGYEGALEGSDAHARVAVAVIYEHAYRRRDGAVAAQIEIGRFSGYDEYGLGVREGARVVYAVDWDHDALATALAAMVAQDGLFEAAAKPEPDPEPESAETGETD